MSPLTLLLLSIVFMFSLGVFVHVLKGIEAHTRFKFDFLETPLGELKLFSFGSVFLLLTLLGFFTLIFSSVAAIFLMESETETFEPRVAILREEGLDTYMDITVNGEDISINAERYFINGKIDNAYYQVRKTTSQWYFFYEESYSYDIISFTR